jgi:diacylglycerol kinase (ATP)
MPGDLLKLLFIINPGAGKNKTDWEKEIQSFFSLRSHQLELFKLPKDSAKATIEKKVDEFSPDRVIAVGGDGTLKLVVEALKGKTIPIGILPAGSANGMATELGIPTVPEDAIETTLSNHRKRISLIRINDQVCIHLSDIGFNAFVVKRFEDENTRGMWGYVKAAWKVLWNYSKMHIRIKLDNEYVERNAAMVVIANATKYGTGVVINPEGRVDDDRFEVVIVKKISFSEIFKMRFTHKPYAPDKTELLQTRSLKITSKHHVHFQVDGEYLGKIKSITAQIVPEAIEMIVPAQNDDDDKK